MALYRDTDDMVLVWKRRAYIGLGAHIWGIVQSQDGKNKENMTWTRCIGLARIPLRVSCALVFCGFVVCLLIASYITLLPGREKKRAWKRLRYLEVGIGCLDQLLKPYTRNPSPCQVDRIWGIWGSY